jgi:hypothetical protein
MNILSGKKKKRRKKKRSLKRNKKLAKKRNRKRIKRKKMKKITCQVVLKMRMMKCLMIWTPILERLEINYTYFPFQKLSNRLEKIHQSTKFLNSVLRQRKSSKYNL